MKIDKLIYWFTTGFICLMFFLGGMMYLFNYEMAYTYFNNFGFPTWIIYPLAILKFLGVIVVITRKSLFLKELAYAGFLYDAILAVAAHIVVEDNQFYHGSAVIIATIVSWIYDRKLFGTYQKQLNISKKIYSNNSTNQK